MASLTTKPQTPTFISFTYSSICLSHSHNFHFKFPILPSSSSSKSISIKVATLPVLSFSDDKVCKSTLDLKSAPPDTARAAAHCVVITDLHSKRRNTASTLTRAERSRLSSQHSARKGSHHTPLRPDSGGIFNPKPCDWSIKINRKEKKLAISTEMTSAEFDKPKTKDFIAAMKRWGLDPKDQWVGRDLLWSTRK